MKTKKFLSTIISFIIISSPISNANRPSCDIPKNITRKLHIEDYPKKHKKPLSEINDLKYLIAYIKHDIKNGEDINKIKNKYYKYFEECLFKGEKDEEKIQDVFTFFLSYIIVGLIAIEIENKKIDFSLLKNLLQYLRSEDMHFLYHAYIVANSHKFLSPSKIYVNHAIEALAKKGKEKPTDITEDLIHKIIRKNPNDEDIEELKYIYDEHLLNFTGTYKNNSNNLTPLQKNIIIILLGIISRYKKRNITNNPIDLYNNYFKETYTTTNPR